MSVSTAFSSATQAWFDSSFEAPTPVQKEAWEKVAAGHNVLVIGPTGSGKTLAGFLWAIDRLATAAPAPEKERMRVLYVSPLKALAVDIERNLRSPLMGIRAASSRLGIEPPDLRVGVRTGDTPADERRRFPAAPPDILITTPESLFLLLTSQAREALRFVETVIVDEIHAVVGTKRGAHLAVSLERLDQLVGKPAQRLGLSATVRPPSEVAAFLGGNRPVEVVAPPSDKTIDVSLVVPIEDMSEPGQSTGEVASGSAAGAEARTSIWPHVEERLLELIRAHQSTIVFVNSRRLAERLCGRLNELAEEEVARAHHGSVSKEQRRIIEDDLKMGNLPAVVATSSLELGIDMAAVDLVIQVESPDSVASGLQRIGRAGHHVGDVSKGVIFPKYRGDLLQCAVVLDRMNKREIEELVYPRNPLDVLAQQIVAMVAMDPWEVDELERLVKQAAPFAQLPRSALEATLDMLSGRYPSTEFAQLRPRINWDRLTNLLTPRSNAQRLAVTSGGTIPDRGLFGVFIAGEQRARVGELDEEMVYESRPGEVFVLGASSWLIEDITPDRVLVSPAPGQAGKMPFWHGDAPGRAVELGKAIGAFVRELSELEEGHRSQRLQTIGLDELAARNLLEYLDEQRDATRVVPDDRTIVVERFKDELGDWRLCVLTPFGARIHAPWAQAIEARIREQTGVEAQSIYTDDGIVIRLPETDEAPTAELVVFEPEEIEDLVIDNVGNSAMFASRFRECSVRSLLLPRRRPGSRTPLWQQRQKSALLLQVARNFDSFPIVLETFRECLQDVFDLKALRELMTDIRSRRLRIVEVETPLPSPFAGNLQFGFVGAFLYEGDSPLAERRAQALSLDRSLLAEILGREELRELIDDDALLALELELQLLADDRKARDPDQLHDALRLLGDLSRDEIVARCMDAAAAPGWLEQIASDRRALPVKLAGEERWISIEDAARFRDALGVSLPPGVPASFLEPVADPLGELLSRFMSCHGPITSREVAARFGLGSAVVDKGLKDLAARGRVILGEFRPQGAEPEWIEIEVLRRLRRRSLAAFRKEVEPAPPEALGRFLPAWHNIGGRQSRTADVDALLDAIEMLQGARIPASVLERQVLPARLPGYTSSLLDQLCAAGEVVWAGGGALGVRDGWVVLALADRVAELLPGPSGEELSGDAQRVCAALSERGALFFRQIADEVGSDNDTELLLALWELVWEGHATNDTLAPVRILTGGAARTARRHGRRRGRAPRLPTRSGPPSATGRWSLLPALEINATRRSHAVANQLLIRHGIVTRGSVGAETVPGGFAAVYTVLKAMEESGHCRRGYFLEGLGGAQFAVPGAVDRMRSLATPALGAERHALLLASTDPANPYGAALSWPETDSDAGGPGRKAGASVVLVDGNLVLFLERGGRSMLVFSEDVGELGVAVETLALGVKDGINDRLTLEKVDGRSVFDSAIAPVLIRAGFTESPKGLRFGA
ncbi:MAG: ATP-dependent helicase Lhr and Lhr-like helicase [Actinomycetota bacterium]|nr:ATP-dependent helicase Lhr and Lhr-like helicase [Actinomycetota bacterium]